MSLYSTILLILLNVVFSKTYNFIGLPTESQIIEKKIVEINNDYATFLKSKNSIKNNLTSVSIYDINEDSNIETRQLSNASYLYNKNVKQVVLVAVFDDEGNRNGLGSGIIVGNNEILTNMHVVNGYEQATIVLYDKSTTTMNQIKDENVYSADIYAIDYSRDLALLKTKEYLYNTITFGNNWEIDIASDVFAIGHPKRNIWSFTYGVISGLPSPLEWEYNDNQQFIANCIQTQTPINPGNSGGPLFNDRGHLIGINSFGDATASGLNFAVRIDEIREFIKDANKGIYPIAEKKKELKWELIKDHSLDDIDELYGADTNNDGDYNYWFVYEDKDDLVDVRIFDIDNDGIPDMIHDVKSNEYIIDMDFDGKYDTIGKDTDDDDWPDEFTDYEE